MSAARSTRPLSERELNRAVLARQLLLDRRRTRLPRAAERIAGVQAQYAPSTYIGLWSRLADLARDDVTAALVSGDLVQATLMRSTIHVVSRADFWPMAAAVREPRRQWWLRASRHRAGAAGMAAHADRVRDYLADRPRRRAEIVRELGIDSTTWNGIGLWLDLVRLPPSGTWQRRRADLYDLAERWVPMRVCSPHDGAVHLVRRYLGGFGPATRADVAGFTGLAGPALDAALAAAAERRYRSGDGADLLDVAGAALPDADTPAPVRFLPTWDATLLIHARRAQILPERYRPLVFSTRTPHSVPTFLVDGQVAGTWRWEGGRVTVRPFEPLPGPVREEVAAEADRLAAFHA